MKSEDIYSSHYDYREYIGKGHRGKHDLMSAQQFIILIELGLREHHKLLDIGCGSLRAGRLLIPYLLKGNYYGIEPNINILDEGIKKESGNIFYTREAHVSCNDQFDLRIFDEKFDFILAHSIFTHTTQAQLRKCLSEISLVLKDDGLFVGTFLHGDNYEGSEWVYPERVTYKEDLIKSLSMEYGLKYSKLNYVHVNGQQSWFSLVKK